MAKSIISNERQCYLCGKTVNLEKHHIFGGTANRKISERLGLWVYLCHNCHTGKNGAQYNKEKNLRLKQDAQRAYEKTHTRDEWVKWIGKNYLG